MGPEPNKWVNNVPVYEPGKPLNEVARELGFASAEEITKLASNENSLGPSPAAIEAIRRTAQNVHRYPEGAAFYLREELARYLAIEPGCLAFGNGSNELIELLGHIYLDENAGVVVSEQAFVVYRLVAALFNAPVTAVPMKNMTHDLDAMLAAIRPNTRLVFIANPNNPTGTMVGRAALDAFMDQVPPHVAVVIDEAYVELLPETMNPQCMRYIRDERPVIVLRTFSKAYGLAGLRIGYAAAPRAIAALVNRVRQPFNVNLLAQDAALAALHDQEHVEKTRAMVAEGLEFIGRCLDDMGVEYVPSVANFMLVKTGAGRERFQAMLKDKVIARAMDGYGLPDYIRVTVGTHEENSQFINVLKQHISQRAAL